MIDVSFLLWTRMHSSMFSIFAFGFTITVGGAQGNLGRELVAQSLQRGWDVVGVVRRPNDPVFMPWRKGWLSPVSDKLEPIRSERLVLTTDTDCGSTDAVVFAFSGKPFGNEGIRQTDVVRRMCDTSPNETRLCFVSAHGTGDSAVNANLGIQVMNKWYLKDVYNAKQSQEDIILQTFNPSLILRPKVLSYENIPLNPLATRRQDLAREILDWVSSSNPGVR